MDKNSLFLILGVFLVLIILSPYVIIKITLNLIKKKQMLVGISFIISRNIFLQNIIDIINSIKTKHTVIIEDSLGATPLTGRYTCDNALL